MSEGEEKRPALPPGWAWANLADICAPVANIQPARDLAHRELFRYIDLGAIANHKIVNPQAIAPAAAPSRARQRIVAGDTLFSCVRVYLENIARVPPELDGEVASTAFAVLRPAEGIDPGYLHWLVRRSQFVRKMVDKQRGNSPPAVLETDVKAAIVPVAPTGEQRRIAARIEELFGEIEAGEQELAKAQEALAAYRRAVLKAAVTGALTEDWRENNPTEETGQQLLDHILRRRRAVWEEHEFAKMRGKGRSPVSDAWKAHYQDPIRPDASSLPKLPRGWIWATLDQLASKMTSGSRAWAPYYDRGSAIFVMAQNVRPGRFDMKSKQYVDPPANDPERARTIVRKDDLLVTIVGANTGDVCRVDIEVADHFVCQSVALMRLVDPAMAEYVECFRYGVALATERLMRRAEEPRSPEHRLARHEGIAPARCRTRQPRQTS